MLKSSVGTAIATDVAAGGRVGISVGADWAWTTAPREAALGAAAALAAAAAFGAVGCGRGVGMGLAVLSAGRVALGVDNGDVWLFDPTDVAGGTVGGAAWVGCAAPMTEIVNSLRA